MQKIILITALILVLLVPVVLLTVQAQQEYTALMLVCGGTYDSGNLHLRQFSNEVDARQWADGEMQGAWDIAYIYNGHQADGALRMVLARSESTCYPDMREWRRFD